MKQSVVIGILLVLGFFAAASAAVLVVVLRLPGTTVVQETAGPPPEVTVMTAAMDLPPRTVLDESVVTETRVPREEAPSAAFTNVHDIKGRMLAVPVSAGEPIMRRHFPSQGSGFELAGMLPQGMRAVSVSLASYSGLDGLLYPGSVVDVLASFSLSGRTELGTAVSTTLLENIQVLAVENLALTTSNRDEIEDGSPNRSDRRTLKVTLMVDSEQAEALQLATEFGQVSLAMRNPEDETMSVRDATLLNEGQLARLADVVNARLRQAEMMASVIEPEPEPVREPVAAPAPRREAPSVSVQVLRGTVTETKSFSSER